VGALLDEYERAINELKQLLTGIPDGDLTTVQDSRTTNEKSRSIQTVLAHVVDAGYWYALQIHRLKGYQGDGVPKILRATVQAYTDDLDGVMVYTEKVLTAFADAELEELDHTRKILTPWGQFYDAEQMMEHAIVHILRHRRQLERWLQENVKK